MYGVSLRSFRILAHGSSNLGQAKLSAVSVEEFSVSLCQAAHPRLKGTETSVPDPTISPRRARIGAPGTSTTSYHRGRRRHAWSCGETLSTSSDADELILEAGRG